MGSSEHTSEPASPPDYDLPDSHYNGPRSGLKAPEPRAPRVGSDFLAGVLWFLVAVSYLAVAVVWLWPRETGPEGSVRLLLGYLAFMLRTFAPFGGLGLLPIALWALWRRRPRLAITATVPLLVLVAPLLADYLPKAAPAIDGPTIRVMHFNLLHSNDSTDTVAGQIRAADPDVLLLHEYDHGWHRALATTLAEAYSYHRCEAAQGSFGWAVFSRLPLAEPLSRPVRPVLHL